MKILITASSFLKPENKEAQALIEAFADEIIYNPYGHALQPEELIPMLEGVDGCIAGVDFFTKEVIEKAPESLKVISRFGVGYDRVDLAAAKARGIAVTITPEANATAVAEYAFAAMLSVARNIMEQSTAMQESQWKKKDGIELKGKTVGIFGLGAIGKRLAKRAQGFEMKVCAHDPYADAAYAEKNNIKLCSFDEMLAKANFLSIHAPYTEETRYIIGAEAIAKLPQDAIIVNTARGGIVDEQAVADAILSGKLYGAAFDVFEEEPLKESVLRGLPNVLLSPHTGAHTYEANANVGFMAAQNAIRILKGESSPYTINK